jgi:6-phospho-3-hexuloisomerase
MTTLDDHAADEGDPFARQLAELTDVLGRIDQDRLAETTRLIAGASRVFLAGRGRNALAMAGFANRLAQLGKPAFLIGDILTPAVRAGDLIIIATSSGTTPALVTTAEAGNRHGASTLALTADTGSPLAAGADHVLTLPSRAVTTRQPLGTLFEQTLILVCDALVVHLMSALDVTTAAMQDRHANLE